MAVELNHTILHAHNQEASAHFLSALLGLPAPRPYGPFLVVQLANNISLDILQSNDIAPQHYAFLVTEDEFDAVMRHISEHGLTHWADPFHRQEGRINHGFGGRGVYVSDPDGHNIEVLTRAGEVA